MKTTAKQYAQTLYEKTDGQPQAEIEKVVADFARYIYKERKLKLAEKIIEQFAAIYNKEKGIAEVEAVTAQKLDNSQIQKVKSYVKEKFYAREVTLKNIVDESIKGGIVLKIGDEIIDGSVRGSLNDLRNIITR